MVGETEKTASVEDEVDRCLGELAANVAAERIVARLNSVAAKTKDDSRLRARFLRARAIATARLGYSGEALADLQEARQLLGGAADPRELAEVERTVALVHSWRGDAREAALALLRAAAVAVDAGDHGVAGLTLLDAGRLEMEIGRAAQAEFFFARGLRVGGEKLSAHERARDMVSLLQALVATDQIERAQACLLALSPMLAAASVRVRFLAALEVARIAIASGKHADAATALDRAEEVARPAPDSFEAVELAHVRAELALDAGDHAWAETLLKGIVARYAVDDLAGREVVARLLQARALFELKRPDEAEQTLAAALRRALARGLNGYADAARSRIAAGGGSEGAWHPGAPLARSDRAEAAQRFVRRRQLGAGGFGNVSRAYDLEQGIEVALKRVTLTNLYEPATRGRLLESLRIEVAAASRIDHPGVARVFGMLIDEDGDALLIQELIDGPTLRSAMASPLEPARVLELAVHISQALTAVHTAGVVHRDLKPENIVLRSANAPVIVDFGVALVARASDKATTIGTAGYMAPEQSRGYTDARADLYALGVIIHELLLGRRAPAPATGLAAFLLEPCRRKARAAHLLAAGVDPEIAAVVARLLAPHRRWRPASAAEVGGMLAGPRARLSSASTR